MFNYAFKAASLTVATIEVCGEYAQELLSEQLGRMKEARAEEITQFEQLKETLEKAAIDTSRSVFDRAELLENRFRADVRRRLADLTDGVLVNSEEIDDLRAQLAKIRAELSQAQRDVAV